MQYIGVLGPTHCGRAMYDIRANGLTRLMGHATSPQVSTEGHQQECPARVSYTSVPQEFPLRVPHKSVPQECHTVTPFLGNTFDCSSTCKLQAGQYMNVFLSGSHWPCGHVA